MKRPLETKNPLLVKYFASISSNFLVLVNILCVVLSQRSIYWRTPNVVGTIIAVNMPTQHSSSLFKVFIIIFIYISHQQEERLCILYRSYATLFLSLHLRQQQEGLLLTGCMYAPSFLSVMIFPI